MRPPRLSGRVVLFFEYVPQDLVQWLREDIARRGLDAVESACVLLKRSMREHDPVAVAPQGMQKASG